MPESRAPTALTLPAGMRVTRAVQVLLSVLPAQQPAQGWTQALAEVALQAQGVQVNRVTVYRALDRLAEAGLLDGKRVTTSWWLAAHLQALAPGCRVEPDFMVLADPPLTTAGAAFAQTDLMLQLLRRRVSPEIADRVSKALLLDRRQLQSPFVIPAILVQGNALVSRLTAQIEKALPQLTSVKALAASAGMSERTLSRHVHKATGHSTRQLIQRVQLNKARALLEAGQYSVEEVATQVGYQDPTALRRLMRRLLNATPRQLRQH